MVLQALVEHYDEYRDYNTTTTQSDYGENIHILLDFLRVKVRYDRYAWRMRPLALAHEVLCKRGTTTSPGKWREFIADKTAGLAEELLDRLGALEVRHGVKLRTIRDRLEERFLLPLEIDQAAARVPPAAEAALAGRARTTRRSPACARRSSRWRRTSAASGWTCRRGCGGWRRRFAARRSAMDRDAGDHSTRSASRRAWTSRNCGDNSRTGTGRSATDRFTLYTLLDLHRSIRI